MPVHILKRTEDKVRDLMQNIDYLLYVFASPFKFKPFPKKIQRILVVELLNIGDIIVITPVLKALKEKYPQAKIDLLVNEKMTQVLSKNEVDGIISYISFKKTLKEIKSRYDLGFMLHPGSFKISLLLLLGRIKYRVGCTKAGITYGKGFFLHKKVFPNSKWQHKIEDNLDVVRAIGIIPEEKHVQLSVSKAAEKKIRKMLSKKSRPWIGINPVSKHWTQEWYADRFAEVADHFSKGTMIFTGLKEEWPEIQALCEKIKSKKNVMNLAGKTNLEELKALIKNLDLLITVDSAPSHIASAFDTPVLTLFGPTVPAFWGPTGKKSAFIWKEKEACVGCRRYYCIYKKDHECMKSITPTEVIKQSERLLKK